MSVSSRSTEAGVFLCIHAGSDQWQLHRAVAGGSHPQAMGFCDHASVDVPSPKRTGFYVLRTKCLGQRYRALDVFRIRFRFDTSPLFFIEGPVAVELEPSVTYSWTRKHSGCDRIRICNQWGHRRSLITNRGHSEIQKAWQ